ncbi:MAG: response regulator [Planctomycetota bacterium]|nr:response regulator [Planctomycetota bacterium]MDE1889493.1 response regulator [Planctomycetota bacterium]MDE2215973.1 response regulator [Planctomycetota bacterium]
MKIRHKLIIILAILMVTLNGAIGFLIYKRTHQEFIKEVREKAKLIAIELETTRNHLASILKTSKIEITEETKNFIPAVSGHAIGIKFAENTGYIIKQTSRRFRNAFNKPDAFEEEVLRKMEENPDLTEYWADDVVDGKRVERYLYALHIKEDCLLCHGPKEQAPKFIQKNYSAGYDYKIGEIRGAISVIIPKELAEQRFAADIVFFIILGSVSILLIVAIIFLTAGKFMKPIERLNAAVTTITKTGDLTTKVDISSKDDVGQLGRAFNDMSIKLQSTYATLEQRIAEKTARLQNAVLALEQANKMKSEFLANMSHELRTPLNAIIGFAEVLRDKISGDLNEEQTEFVNDIHSSGLHLLQMINDILDLSKIEAGKLELQYETFSVPEAIEDVHTILKGLASKKRLELKTTMLTDVKNIEADRVKFKQILYNLLSNAIKFTPENGKITVETCVTDDMLQVSVSDTGIGMKPEDQEKIFKEFWQADSSFSRKYEGTGLGLALTKRIVEMHGGNIWFESEYGKGSIFYFALPLKATLIAAKPKEVEVKPRRIESTVGKEAKTVLVVEDDRMASNLLTVYLTNAGYNVIVAVDGEEAIKKAKEYHPFFITLDIMLPKVDGWDVLSELKNSPDTADIPVIIVSIVDNKELGYSLGAAEYLIKPIDREKLINTVNACIAPERNKGKPMKILVVDDDEKAVKYMSAILENAGFEALKAYSGTAGINLAINSNPDLIILDLMMPEVSGFDVVEKLRIHPTAKGIPIIICSAKDITPADKKKLNGNILVIVKKGSHTKEDLLAAIKKIEQVRVIK